ncbi:MAG TPA: redoxin domain-containing protein [bacterium]|nr:redoxin domain-containing protein [bacterium]
MASPAPKPTPAPKPEHKGPKVGENAPDFTLQDQFGADVKLSDLRGKKVLLSFHPLAWTPVCELQMRTLELKKKALDDLNTVPLGISVDSMHSKREWATFIELDQVQILADFWPHGEVAKKYGQFIDKKGVSGRVNILIDEAGKIAWVKVYDLSQLPDIEEVLAVIRSKGAKKK